MRVLMVGVDEKRYGGMWTVANNYIKNKKFNEKVDLDYVATSTNGNAFKRLFFMFKGFKKIKRILKNKKIDIVHIHMAERGSTFRKGHIAMMTKKKGCKVVVQLHAGPFMAWYNTLKESKKKKIVKIFECSDKVLVLGEYWKKELASIINPDKMEVLYNGVQIPNRNLFDISSENIVYMGVLKREKGIYDLIDAIESINEKIPQNIKVLLCGNDLEGDIAALIKEKKLENRIKLLGWIDEQKRDDVYRKSLISVLPSYFEALSMTIIEAMSYGIPIITTNISTMREILGEKAMLVKPGNVKQLANSILKIVNDKEKLNEMSKDEYNIVCKKFSIENNIAQTLDIYSNLMESD
ncbi:MAG: glycosyltransferase family 4 protein [Bacilli bacterium]|nr:glycosyltransferase family 4 protein [Bacilli bacterium]